MLLEQTRIHTHRPWHFALPPRSTDTTPLSSCPTAWQLPQDADCSCSCALQAYCRLLQGNCQTAAGSCTSHQAGWLAAYAATVVMDLVSSSATFSIWPLRTATVQGKTHKTTSTVRICIVLNDKGIRRCHSALLMLQSTASRCPDVRMSAQKLGCAEHTTCVNNPAYCCRLPAYALSMAGARQQSGNL
jgi:hypothetical protein